MVNYFKTFKINSCLTEFNNESMKARIMSPESLFTIIEIIGAGEQSMVCKVMNEDNQILALSITQNFKIEPVEMACQLNTLSKYTTEAFYPIVNWIIISDQVDKLLVTMPLLEGLLSEIDPFKINENALLGMCFELSYGYLVTQKGFEFVHGDIWNNNVCYRQVNYSRIYPIR